MIASPFAAAHRQLDQCLQKNRQGFSTLFNAGVHRDDVFSVDFGALIELGITEVSEGQVNVIAPIVAFRDLFFKCDHPNSPSLDRVFPLHEDESALLARWVTPTNDDAVLDIGTGAGIVALSAAAAGADRVIATDVNPKVKEYFNFNAALNGLANRVQYVESDLFSGLGDESFSVIACNPPFVPVPIQTPYFLHSNGGPLGTAFLERLLQEFPARLLPNGELFVLALSLTTAGRPRIAEFASDLDLIPIYNDGCELNVFFESFRGLLGFSAWKDQILDAGYDSLSYFGATSGGNSVEAVNRLSGLLHHPCSEPLACLWHELSWSMTARCERYACAHIGLR